jgi:hypothetical protein
MEATVADTVRKGKLAYDPDLVPEPFRQEVFPRFERVMDQNGRMVEYGFTVDRDSDNAMLEARVRTGDATAWKRARFNLADLLVTRQETAEKVIARVLAD